MLARFWYWLFHKHTWFDISKAEIVSGLSNERNGTVFTQCCLECNEYRFRKLKL